MRSPTPWIYEVLLFAPTGELSSGVSDVDGILIADIQTNDEDGQLMAAAPELLKVAKDARTALEYVPPGILGCDHETGYFYRDELLHNIIAAIAKAEGPAE